MRKLICVALATVALLLSISACTPSSMGPINFSQMQENYEVGKTVTLKVEDAIGRVIDADRLYWSVDDNKIAQVTADGVLSIKGAGLVQVTAMDKTDLSNQAKIKIFCPYEMSEATETSKVKADEDSASSGVLDTLTTTLVSTGKKVVSSMTGKVSSLGIASMIFSFFDKDKYMFTLTESRHTIENGVVYTVCDWSNKGWYFDPKDVTTERIYQNLGYAFNIDNPYGSTLEDLTIAVQNEFEGKAPNDGMYHLDLLDDKYEYRVVVLADYTTVRVRDYYSNGAITGLGMTAKELLALELSSFDDVNNNWQYHNDFNEIVDVKNIRLCVEFRERA